MNNKLWAVLLAATLALGACGGNSSRESERLSIVVSTNVLGDVVQNVVGSDAVVEVLMPPGTDPHSFVPSSADAAAMSSADLVVINGLGLEEGLEDTIDSVIGSEVPVFSAGDFIETLAIGESDHDHEDEGDHDHEDEAEHDHEDEGDHDHEDEGDHDHEDEGDHDHEDEGDHDHEDEGDHDHDGGLDPHLWMDPLRMVDVVQALAHELEAIDPEVDWATGAADYISDLELLAAEMSATFSRIPSDAMKLVTNHDSLGYLVDRFGFELVGAVIPGGSTLSDPSSSELADLISLMREEGVNVVFADIGNPTALSEAVAAELGADVAVVQLFTGSLGGPDSGASTYIDMMKVNAQRIVDALS